MLRKVSVTFLTLHVTNLSTFFPDIIDPIIFAHFNKGPYSFQSPLLLQLLIFS